MGVGDDEVICEQSSPPLSSIRFNFAEESYQAALELERIIAGRSRQRTPRTFVCKPACVTDRESVAAAQGVSESLLSLRFRELARKTVWETITDARLDAVKRLLRTTTRPIGEITRQTGFKDTNNLKRLFKSKTGLSMREWRKLRD